MRTMVALLVVLLLACSRQSGPSERTTPAETGGPVEGGVAIPAGAPSVSSVDILPVSPVADKPLSVQFTGRDSSDEPTTYSFRWFVDGGIVQDGPEATLQPGQYRKGSEIFVEAIASNRYGAGQPFRSATAVVQNQPPAVTAVSFNPVPAYSGSVITAVPDAQDPDNDEIDYSFQWKVNGKASSIMDGAGGGQLATQGLKKRDVISVVVIPADNDAKGKPYESGGLILSNSAPQITSSAPSSLQGGPFVYQVIAKDPDGDMLTYALDMAPEGMTISRSTGLIRWEPGRPVSGSTEARVKVSASDGDGGIAIQEFTLTVEMR